MNILFVSFCDIESNSGNHIRAWAEALRSEGHEPLVAAPKESERAGVYHYREILKDPARFSDGKCAEVVHAWTPREIVRQFCFQYFRDAGGGLLIHLEDNEEILLERALGANCQEIAAWPVERRMEEIPEGLMCPVRGNLFLELADGASVITPALGDFVPDTVPVHQWTPLVDEGLFCPQEAQPELRSQWGIAPEDFVLLYNGNDNVANEADMETLYRAVGELARAGVPVKLLRTGQIGGAYREDLVEVIEQHVIELGFVDREMLPQLIALGDAVIQPGSDDRYNHYRLPSKLVEYMAMGKPIILPGVNIGSELEDGEDALLLKEGSVSEMVAQCQRLYSDDELRKKLSHKIRIFYEVRFARQNVVDFMVEFYRGVAKKGRSCPSVGFLARNREFSTRAEKSAWLLCQEEVDQQKIVAEKWRRALRKVEKNLPREGNRAKKIFEKGFWKNWFS